MSNSEGEAGSGPTSCSQVQKQDGNVADARAYLERPRLSYLHGTGGEVPGSRGWSSRAPLVEPAGAHH